MRLGDGDGQLAARAGGEGRERLADPVQRVGLLDGRLQAAGRNLGGEPVERGGVRIREYTRDARVRHRELVGGHDQRRRQPAARHEQFAERGAVAREVEHGLDATRPDRPHLLRHVAPVVHAVGRAEVAHEVRLVARLGGRDHGRAPRRDELDGVGADPARRAADQDGLAGRRGDRVYRLEGRRSGQAEHAGGGEVDALRDARQVRPGGHREVFGERPAAERRRVGDDAEDAVAPAAKPVTPAPTASTVPAKSLPSTTGKRYSSMPCNRPLAMDRSMPLTEAACTRTSTSPGPASGVGMSASVGWRSKSGKTNARMVLLLVIATSKWIAFPTYSKPYHKWR